MVTVRVAVVPALLGDTVSQFPPDCVTAEMLIGALAVTAIESDAAVVGFDGNARARLAGFSVIVWPKQGMVASNGTIIRTLCVEKFAEDLVDSLIGLVSEMVSLSGDVLSGTNPSWPDSLCSFLNSFVRRRQFRGLPPSSAWLGQLMTPLLLSPIHSSRG
jgi:hypothetical protein